MHGKRKLGYWEITCKYGHDLFSGSGNVVALTEVTEELQPEILMNALSYLYKRHPVLQAVFYDEEHHYYFDYPQNLHPLPFEIYTQTNWQAMVETQMHAKFDVTQALWRACFNTNPNQHQLIFAAHHAAADGLSLIFLLQEWLGIYHQLSNHKNITITALPKLNAIEAILNSKNTWQAFINYKKNYQPHDLKPWPFYQQAPTLERRTRIIYKTMHQAILSALKRQCQQHKLTINAALNAALLFAIQFNQTDPLHTTLHTPINLRRYAKPVIPNEQMGCFISMVMTEHKLTVADNFWSVAQAYQDQLQERIPQLGFCPTDFSIAHFDIAELRLLFDMLSNSKRKNFSCGFGISNLGQIPCTNNMSSLNPTRFIFCTNRIIGDFVIFLNILSYQNTMHLGFCYPEPLVDRTWVSQVINDFEEILTLVARLSQISISH